MAAQSKALSAPKDFDKVIDDQKYYADKIQAEVSTSAQDAYEVATKSSEEVASLVTDSISDAVNMTIPPSK